MNPHSASQFVFCGSERSLIRQRSACLKESLWEGSSGRPGYMLGGATRHLLRGDIAKNCVEKRAAWCFLHPPCPGCRSASVWKQEMTKRIQISRDVFCLWCPQSPSLRRGLLISRQVSKVARKAQACGFFGNDGFDEVEEILMIPAVKRKTAFGFSRFVLMQVNSFQMGKTQTPALERFRFNMSFTGDLEEI